MDNSYLQHHGIKGMKWGVRRYQNKDGSYTNAGKKRRSEVESYKLKTKSGDEITMVRDRGGVVAKALGTISPAIRKEQERSLNYDIYSPQGKKAGTFQAHLKSPEEFNIVWGDTKKEYRGRGYMQAVTKQGEAIAKKYGRTKLTAELVGTSPDIHHIAKKQGWVVVGEERAKEVLDAWGGLTLVEKRLY